MRTRLLALTLTALLVVPACTLLQPVPATPGSGVGAPSFVGQVAIYGRQFVVAGDGALTALDLLIGSNIIDRPTGVGILTVMKRMGDESVRLAGMLRVIDQTRTGLERASAIQRARAVVAGIIAMFDDALVPIPNERLRTITAAALATAKAIVGDFDRTLAAPPTTVDWNLEADAIEAAGLRLSTEAAAALAAL